MAVRLRCSFRWRRSSMTAHRFEVLHLHQVFAGCEEVWGGAGDSLGGTVAHALVRATSALLPTLGECEQRRVGSNQLFVPTSLGCGCAALRGMRFACPESSRRASGDEMQPTLCACRSWRRLTRQANRLSHFRDTLFPTIWLRLAALRGKAIRPLSIGTTALPGFQAPFVAGESPAPQSRVAAARAGGDKEWITADTSLGTRQASARVPTWHARVRAPRSGILRTLRRFGTSVYFCRAGRWHE